MTSLIRLIPALALASALALANAATITGRVVGVADGGPGNQQIHASTHAGSGWEAGRWLA